MHRKCWENMEELLLSFIQNCMEPLDMLLKKKVWDITVGLELFLEMYSAFSEEELPAEKQVREILLSYVNDYCQDMVETRIREGVDPEEDFAVNIINEI